MKIILFACAENKKRSQIAEALFNYSTKGMQWRAISGGTAPVDEIDPLTIEVLQEANIPIEGLTPKKVTKEMLNDADFIVSFGCLVPSLFPKEKFREWNINDPKTLDDFRNVREVLRRKIQILIDEIKNL